MWKDVGEVNPRYLEERQRLERLGFEVSGIIVENKLVHTDGPSVHYSYVTPRDIGENYPIIYATGDLINPSWPRPVANLTLDGKLRLVNQEFPQISEHHRTITA